MTLTSQLATHIRSTYTGGNSTGVCLKDAIDSITTEEAVTGIFGLNTIAALVYHIHYYVAVLALVLEGGPLEGRDEDSFLLPPVRNRTDWDNLLDTAFSGAERLASLVEAMPESRLEEPFVEPRYGTWYRNVAGVVEHANYHMGQIMLIRKILRHSASR